MLEINPNAVLILEQKVSSSTFPRERMKQDILATCPQLAPRDMQLKVILNAHSRVALKEGLRKSAFLRIARPGGYLNCSWDGNGQGPNAVPKKFGARRILG